MVNAHGLDIANFVNGGGGLYAMAETPSQAGVAPFGWLTSDLPALGVVIPAPGASRRRISRSRPTVRRSSPLSSSPTSRPVPGRTTSRARPASLPAVVTEDSPSGTPRNIILTSKSAVLTPFMVTIDTTPPGGADADRPRGEQRHGLQLNTDGITQANNSKASPSNAPIFDVGSVTQPARRRGHRAAVPHAGRPATLIPTRSNGARQHADEHPGRDGGDRRHQPERPDEEDAGPGDPRRDVSLHGGRERPGRQSESAERRICR